MSINRTSLPNDVLSHIFSYLDIVVYEQLVYQHIDKSHHKQAFANWLDACAERKTNKYGTQYTINNMLHSVGGIPSIQYIDGSYQWYRRGLLHRDGDLPAVRNFDGSREWWLEGARKRAGDEPTRVDKDGTRYWIAHGDFVRETGPVIEYPDGSSITMMNGSILYYEEADGSRNLFRESMFPTCRDSGAPGGSIYRATQPVTRAWRDRLLNLYAHNRILLGCPRRSLVEINDNVYVARVISDDDMRILRDEGREY